MQNLAKNSVIAHILILTKSLNNSLKSHKSVQKIILNSKMKLNDIFIFI